MKQHGMLKYSILMVIITALALVMIPGIFGSLKYGLDLQGGFEVLYEVSSLNEGEELTKDMLSNTKDHILKRVDKYGVSEPVINI